MVLLAAFLASPLRGEDLADAGPAPAPQITKLLGFGLGWQNPLASPGQAVPIVALFAFGDGLLGEGTELRAGFETATLSTRFEIPLFRSLFAGARGSATMLGAQGAPYRYDGGERCERFEIESNVVGSGPVFGFRIAPKVEVQAFIKGRRFFYARRDTTGTGLVKPPDHTECSFGVEGSADRMNWFQDWQIAEGWEAGFSAEYFRRDAWADWGLPEAPQTRANADREGGRATAWGRGALRFQSYHDVRLTLQAGTAWDVDVLSGFRCGSLVGSPTLPGYYYGELPCDRYLFLELRSGHNLWQGARVTLAVKSGGFREIGGPYRGALCFSVKLTQKVFFGMPLSLEYGFSPTAKRGGSTGGHELYVLVAGAVTFGADPGA